MSLACGRPYWCLVPAAWLVSAAGCSQPSAPIEHEVARRIEAFEKDQYDFVSFGVPHTVGNENTDFILAHRKEAIPVLHKALRNRDRPKAIGFAAFCLRSMRDRTGKGIAAKALADIEASKTEPNLDRVFARNELLLYIKQEGRFAALLKTIWGRAFSAVEESPTNKSAQFSGR